MALRCRNSLRLLCGWLEGSVPQVGRGGGMLNPRPLRPESRLQLGLTRQPSRRQPRPMRSRSSAGVRTRSGPLSRRSSLTWEGLDAGEEPDLWTRDLVLSRRASPWALARLTFRLAPQPEASGQGTTVQDTRRDSIGWTARDPRGATPTRYPIFMPGMGSLASKETTMSPEGDLVTNGGAPGGNGRTSSLSLIFNPPLNFNS